MTSRVLHLGLGAVGPILVVGIYHTLCFGSPFRTAYSHLVAPKFVAGHASGLLGIHPPRIETLLGLLVGPRRGLFYVAPVAIPAAVALFGLLIGKVRHELARVGSAALILLLLANSGYYMWWGGAAAGPRHLVPALGFLAVGLSAAWDRPKARAPLLIFAFLSMASMLLITAVGLEAPEQADILRSYAWPAFHHGRVAFMSGATNLGIELGLARGASLGPLLVWYLVGLRYLVKNLAIAPETPETTEDPKVVLE